MAITRNLRFSRSAVGLALAISGLLVAPLAAHAAPTTDPTTVASATAQLDDLKKQSDLLTEQANAAQIALTAAQAAATQADAVVAAADAKLKTSQAQLAVSVAAQYKGAAFSHTAALLTSNSADNYLETVSSIDILTQHQAQIAAIAAVDAKTAAAAHKTAADALAAANDATAALAAKRKDLDGQIAKVTTIRNTLSAAQLASYDSPVSASFRVAIGPGSATGQAAVAEAQTQLGKPYSWGGGGPGSYDCSGLTMWSYAQVGVRLPHSAAWQQGMGAVVDRSNLSAGDLVFFGNPAYHVAMYVGSGYVIHAPTFGQSVRIVPLTSLSDYAGARRVA